MALHRFKLTNASYGDVALTDVEVALVVDDPIVGKFGLWSAEGTVAGDPDLPGHGRLSGDNELGTFVQGDAMLQLIGGKHGNPIKLTGEGPLTGAPPRDRSDESSGTGNAN